MIRQSVWIIPLILFAVTIVVGLGCLAANPGTSTLTGDSAQYDEYARNLLAGKGYVCGKGLFAHRPPGYPLFLALIYSVFSYSLFAVKIVQCFLNALTCVITYFVGKK